MSNDRKTATVIVIGGILSFVIISINVYGMYNLRKVEKQ